MQAHFWPSGMQRSWPKYADAPVHPKALLTDILKTTFNTDAHFVTYSVEGKSKLPRMGKVAQSTDNGLQIHLIAADLDREPHDPWESEAQAKEALLDALSRCPRASGYTTPRGMRLLWVLQNPVPIRVADNFINRWYAVLRGRGLTPDTNCAQWTRAFRLPKVRVKGKRIDGHLDLYALEAGLMLDYQPKRLGSTKIPDRRVFPEIKVHPDNARATVMERLTHDSQSRRALADHIGGEISGNRAHHMKCPICSQDSVWFLIIPETGSDALCNHRNSCGWIGHPFDLWETYKNER